MSLLAFFIAQAQQPEAPPLQPLPHPELPDPTLITAGPSWWVYAAAAILVFSLLALILWMLFRPAKASPPLLKKPWQTAMNRLRDILAQASQKPPSETAAAVSETLRVYFLERYKIPAPFRTSQELFQRGGIPATSLRLTRYAALADIWDQLAFAPVPVNSSEASALVQKAIESLEEDRL
ncbi:MAG: DUF4381 family protein [Prosthecobacter sp.]